MQIQALTTAFSVADSPFWVCTKAEWRRAQEGSDEADGLPWPLDAVRELTTL